MRNARTFAASASSWSTRARRIAFSSSTAAEHKEGGEDEEEGGEEGEEEGGEEDEEERGEEDELLLDFFPPAPAPAPALAPGLTARLSRMRAASFDGGFLAVGDSGVVSQARAHEQQQHAHTHPAFHVSQGTLASLLLHPGHSLHRVLLREKPCVSQSSDDKQQTNLLCFGGPSPGNPSVALNATCTSNPRRTAPSTGKHSLLFCLAVRTAYCTAEPTFVGAAAVGNCAAPPDSIGEHEDRRASETAMDSTSARPPPRAHMVACLAMEWLEWLECSCSQKHC